MSSTVIALVPRLTAVTLDDGLRTHLELECSAGGRDRRSRMARDREVRDFPRRAMCPAKQLAVDEQAEPRARSERQERRVAASAGAAERVLTEHREIHVVLDCHVRPEAAAQVAEDMEVPPARRCLESWKYGRCEDRWPRHSHHYMTRARDFDADGLRQLGGAGRNLLGHMRSAAPIRGLGELRQNATMRVCDACGELRAAQVRPEAVIGMVVHWCALRGGGRGKAAASSATPNTS